LFQLKDGRLVSGSRGKLIKIWSPKGELTETHAGHSNSLQRFIQHEERLMSICCDATIMVWNLNTNHLEIILKDYKFYYTYPVAVLSDGKITSASVK